MKLKHKKIVLPIILILLVCIISITIYWGVVLYQKYNYQKNYFTGFNSLAPKTILFIGDGMGENHIKTTSSYYQKDMFITSFETSGYVTTFSNALLSPTDSAAAGSALSTGQKFDNGEIARHNHQDIQTLGEYAKNLGLGVGIITTDNIYGATPSAFSAHADSRSDTTQIIQSQLYSNVDLFLGAGTKQYQQYQTNFEQQQYNFVTDYSNLLVTSNKIIGVFESVLPQNGTNISPTLEMLTSFALQYFEANFPNGYFLMIEGAHIDKKSHDNNIIEMMKYMNSFDQSVEIAYNKIGNQNGVAIIVTADHETGGLQFSNQTQKDISNNLFTTSSHTNKNVPYFFYLNTNISVKKDIPKTIDNTDISRLCRALLKK